VFKVDNESLVKLYQEGDKQALDELVANNSGIVHKIAYKYYTEKTSSIDVDDLIQEGYLGLMAAAEKYNPDHEKKAQFVTYAIYLINWKIKRFILTRNTNEEISLNEPLRNDEDKRELVDSLEWPYNQYEALEEKMDRLQLRKELEDMMQSNINLMEREIIEFIYGWNNSECMTVKEVGELFDIPADKANHIQKKAFRKMQNSTWGRMKRDEWYKEKIMVARIRSNYAIEAMLNNVDWLEKQKGVM